MKAMMAIAVGMAGVTLALVNVGAAHADTRCAMRNAAIYFEKGKAEVTPASQEIVERVAKEAKACHGAQVIAAAPAGALEASRARAITRAFNDAGVHVVLASGSPVAPRADVGVESVLDRSASVRVRIAGPVG